MKIVVCIIYVLFLSACGGGGGGSSNSQAVTSDSSSSSVMLLNQIFTFKDVGPITLSLNDTFANKAVAQGSGAVIYSSTNTSVATVDSDGVVTTHELGSTEIVASIVADTRYSAASTSYQLVVSNNANITAWIGSNDALLELPSAMSGSEIYSSNDKNCNWSDYVNCINGILNIITPSGFTDKNATLNNPAYYLLKNNNKKTNFVLSKNVSLSFRTNPRVVTFKNQMWVIGGGFNPDDRRNDVWSSGNGIVWTQQTSAAAFSPRAPQAVLSFNDKLWLFGSQSRLDNDIWSSSDGINWTQVSAVLPFQVFSGTDYHVVAFNNQLWVIASTFSYENGATSVELLSSADGISWQKHSVASEFFNAQLIVKGNKLLLLGAGGANRLYSLDTTVWSSSDGDNWIKETSNAELTYGEFRTIVSHGTKLFAIGGATITSGFNNPWYNDDNDVWSSDDGVYWEKLVDHAIFSSRRNPEVVEFDDQLWLVGVVASDIWASKDGIDWSLKTTDIDVPETSNDYLLSDGNRLLLGIGRRAIEGIAGGVWSSQNGINWSQQKATTPIELTSFRPASTGNVVYFKDKYWAAIGLELYGYYPARHIFSSVNGVDWVKEKFNGLPISDLPMEKITVPQIVKFKNKLWMYGFDYIWTSSDGINWDVMLEKMPLTPDHPNLGQRLRLEILDDNTLLLIRTYDIEKQFDSPVNAWISHDGVTWVNHPLPVIGLVESVVSFDHKFWLFVRAGKYITENGRDFEGILSSVDGVNWEVAVESLPFPLPSGVQVVVHKDKLLLLGRGFFPDEPNRKAVWSSSDGISWRLGFSHPLDFTQ